MKQRFLILSDGYLVVQTELVDPDSFDLFDPKYIPFFVFEDAFWEQRTPVFSKGDLIPLDLHGIRFLKEKGEIVRYNRTGVQKKSDILDFEGLLDSFLKNRNSEIVQEVREYCESVDCDEDIFYRGIYNSLKMYRIREMVASLAVFQMEIVTGSKLDLKTNKEISDKYKELGFNSKMQNMLDQTLLTFFNMEKNQPELWVKDMQVLYSSLNMFNETSKFLVKVCDDFDKKEGFLFTESSILSFYEAGAMQLWLPLGKMRGNSVEKNVSIRKKFFE